MKKFILGITTLICYSTMAQGFEANIKVGYDFYRSSTKKYSYYDDTSTSNYGRGFVVGVEVLPIKFKNDKIKLGAGVEYNFGESSVKYENKTKNRFATMIPLYATAKFTYYRPKNIDLNLYTFARLGWAFAREMPNNNRNGYPYYGKDTSGLYYGLGFGIDYKYFLAEILYDGKYNNKIQQLSARPVSPVSIYIHKPNGFYMKHYFHHKVGVRLGLQLGTQHFKKPQILDCPKCEPKIIERVVEKKTTNKIIIKKFDISAQALFAFDKYGLSDLKENGKKEISRKVRELQESGFEITGMNVIGHTDRLGTDAYNYKLGLNRANTIREYLKDLGIKVEISSSSMGKTNPKVYCDNSIKPYSKLKECLQPNRRVEIQFIGLETQQKVEEVIENK